MNSQKTRLIIDGNNFLYRAYHVKKQPNYLKNGLNTTPIYQFLVMLKNIVSKFEPDEIILTWDKRLNPTPQNFRKKLAAYKEQRTNVDDHQQIIEYTEHIQKFADALGIKTILPYDLEADDVIAYIVKQNWMDKNIIISSDKDLLQLVHDYTCVYSPAKDIIINESNFHSIVGVYKHQYILYKAVLGDISDNIPGLYKYGPIKTKKLLDKLAQYNHDNSPSNRLAEFVVDPLANLQISNDLTDDQMETIRRNIQIMSLTDSSVEVASEHQHYAQQEIDLEGTVHFSMPRFKELCYEYDCPNLVREGGRWNYLFNKEIEVNDILSQISL